MNPVVILEVHLDTGTARLRRLPEARAALGGSGLAATLFSQYARPTEAWDHPDQPIIFAIGPLTGYFPLMSKTVCAFVSPRHGGYAESHAGGRSALALRFAGLDALVLVGRAPRPSVVHVGAHHVSVQDAGYLWGMDALSCAKLIRRQLSGSGHRSIWRIGVAGERKSPMACINVDTFRHFGRLGCGAALGAKNIKAVAVTGEDHQPLPTGKKYAALYADIFRDLTDTEMMHKYHNLGTPENLEPLDALQALPWRNLQATSNPEAIGTMSGQHFADTALLRNAACAGCPVGCVHIGFVREKFLPQDNRYLYRQVSYDYEPIFALGTMLDVRVPTEVLALLDDVEKAGLDAMSAGVALAWATEAMERGIITEAHTGLHLAFGATHAYREAIARMAEARQEFWAHLAQGADAAAQVYGGADFACVLGQEMAGYATGETFFVSQALGLRHSHLDTGAYSYDQANPPKDTAAAVRFLVEDEAERVLLTSMVACLFARKVYTRERLAECLAAIGQEDLAGELAATARTLQARRWQQRLAFGFDPMAVSIPRRFTEVVTWRGPMDTHYLAELQQAYARAIQALAAETPA
ncbi:MAG TPA: aldehyde ferredoxin oxidoreductase [Desulfomicrobiaceae bacterium]|nr:aldehyde ferredoxin oxidoreductase [Desulfomicrobiaceae bacterium]